MDSSNYVKMVGVGSILIFGINLLFRVVAPPPRILEYGIAGFAGGFIGIAVSQLMFSDFSEKVVALVSGITGVLYAITNYIDVGFYLQQLIQRLGLLPSMYSEMPLWERLALFFANYVAVGIGIAALVACVSLYVGKKIGENYIES